MSGENVCALQFYASLSLCYIIYIMFLEAIDLYTTTAVHQAALC